MISLIDYITIRLTFYMKKYRKYGGCYRGDIEICYNGIIVQFSKEVSNEKK